MLYYNYNEEPPQKEQVYIGIHYPKHAAERPRPSGLGFGSGLTHALSFGALACQVQGVGYSNNTARSYHEARNH